ncbi:TetR/AcrR family transcriptional regulator [Mycobacterium avium]|nr:TetR/AcrR family transcriptional regulator [Mycobacterium avium]TXA40455.1 TetR/AcrR family transcriptional regulator [Mycobacterium tuberculosis variant bovis]KDP06973.1 TetR family transcriptional regulator [Mycobacterium avium subsp. hominissuis 101]MBZ4508186.1 TetR/AcrR family transcriptional regulator [Mycobacterium avium subsp. hominissuis]MBZ4517178.1 TetR/AcrR family transcriptional regulator [Mycobacterium avium subsp. hominissuis]MBZ4527227.1 TetR/AcrR family transcriptional regu
MTDTSTDLPAGTRRRNASGESTRLMLIEVAERLFAGRGIEAVTLKEIQQAAGQSNASVIRYHFGSRDGLIRALVSYRQASLAADRQQMLAAMREQGKEADPRAVVWLLVRPLANSIAAGEMFVPFLARLSEDPRARSDYWPEHVDDEWTQEQLEELVEAALQDFPERVRRGRTFQLYISLINVLAAAARAGHGLSEAQLHNYVDAWVGMLTAPVSYETRALIAADES